MEMTIGFVPDEVIVLEGNTIRFAKERSCLCTNQITKEKIIPVSGNFVLARQYKTCRNRK